MLFAMYINRHGKVGASGLETANVVVPDGQLLEGVPHESNQDNSWTLKLSVQLAHKYLGHPDDAKT